MAAYLVMMREHGVRLRERAPVVRLRVQGGRVTGVETPDGVIAAERVILAGGVGQGRWARWRASRRRSAACAITSS